MQPGQRHGHSTARGSCSKRVQRYSLGRARDQGGRLPFRNSEGYISLDNLKNYSRVFSSNCLLRITSNIMLECHYQTLSPPSPLPPLLSLSPSFLLEGAHRFHPTTPKNYRWRDSFCGYGRDLHKWYMSGCHLCKRTDSHAPCRSYTAPKPRPAFANGPFM